MPTIIVYIVLRFSALTLEEDEKKEEDINEGRMQYM